MCGPATSVTSAIPNGFTFNLDVRDTSDTATNKLVFTDFSTSTCPILSRLALSQTSPDVESTLFVSS